VSTFNELHLEIEKRLLELLLILQIDEEHLHQPAALLLLPIPAFLLLELEAKLLPHSRSTCKCVEFGWACVFK
jgi:hypothetical protein